MGSNLLIICFTINRCCRGGGAWSNAADSRSAGLGLREFNRFTGQISSPAHLLVGDEHGKTGKEVK